jgi:hypothetical protein
MDPNRFDAFVKSLSRRGALRVLIGVAGGTFAALGLTRTANACYGWSSVCLDICCDGSCVDTDTSPSNCGYCGNRCDDHLTCRGGDCRCYYDDQEDCGHACVSLDTSAENCGACGNRCSEGATCVDGRCTEPARPPASANNRGSSGTDVRPSDATVTGVAGSSYTSPTWGFSYSWDDDIWSVVSGSETVDTSDADGTVHNDCLSMIRDDSIMGICGFDSGALDFDDPTACVDWFSDLVCMSNSLDGCFQATGSDGRPIGGVGSDGGAFAIYVYRDSGANGSEWVFYTECRTLAPPDGYLTIVHFASREDYNDEIRWRVDVLDTLELGTTGDTSDPYDGRQAGAPPPEPRCVGAFEVCETDRDCCGDVRCNRSNYCDPYCRELFDPCSSGGDCCSGQCIMGGCGNP